MYFNCVLIFLLIEAVSAFSVDAAQISPNPNPKDHTIDVFSYYNNFADSNNVIFRNYGNIIIEQRWGIFTYTLNNYNDMVNESGGTIKNLGGLNNLGYMINKSNAILDNYAGMTNSSGATLDNFGILNNHKFITNESGAILNNKSGGYIYDYSLNNHGTLNNYGTFDAYHLESDGILDNYGILNNLGDGNYPDRLDNHGTLLNESDATLMNSNEFLFNKSGATLKNYGTLKNQNFATLNNESGASLYNFGKMTYKTAGKLHNKGTMYNNGTLDFASTDSSSGDVGSLENSGILYNSGTLNIQPCDGNPANKYSHYSYGDSNILGNTGKLYNKSGAILNNSGMLRSNLRTVN